MSYSKDNPEGLIEFKKRRAQAVKDWRERTKKKIIQSMGGSCQICGYDRFHHALELHHIDPTEKEKGIAELMARPSNPSKYFDELRKCILLCSNCHREVHGGFACVPENHSRFDESVFTDFDTPKMKERKKRSKK